MKQSRENAARGLRAIMATAAVAAGLTAIAAPVHAAEKYTLCTSWFAQAEHGGFYQAKATGLYDKAGLDITIKMGGPQVNSLQLLLGGQCDFVMAYGVRALNAVKQGLPVITVATSFQKDPGVLIAHPHIKSLEEIKGHPLLISTSVRQTWWSWVQAKYGYTEAQTRPYTFSVAPFLTDKELVQQGYISSEPFAIEKGGIKPKVFLLADYGYPDYSATIETRQDLVKKDPESVRKFVLASMQGWKDYLANPGPGNELIKKDNPQMTDAQIEYGIAKMKEYGIPNGGDAATKGIGVMTDARWKQIYEFLAAADLLPKDLDYKKAYTLEFLPKTPILPSK
jgi:NitT/TauT family transport system substrate-binding protein